MNNHAIQQIKDGKLLALQEPEWFFANILRTEIDEWQLIGIEAIADVHRVLRGEPTVINHEGLNRISVTSCHGPGKTHWLAQIMHWWNWCFYGLVVCTAPKEGQLKTRLWPRYRKILREAIPEYSSLVSVHTLTVSIADYVNGRLVFDDDWGCIGETASDPENMAGYHDTPQLILVDEASGKRLDPMFPVLEGTLTTPGSVLAQIGNPTRGQGEFFNAHNKPSVKRLFFDMHIVPKLRQKELTKLSTSTHVFGSERVDNNWILQMESKYGIKSPVVQVRAYGMFADMDENQLIPLSWFDRACVEEFSEDGSIPRIRITVDVADGGEDETIVTVAKMYESFTVILKKYRYSFPTAESPILAAEAAMQIAEDWGYKLTNGDDIVVDSLGVGAGTAGYIIRDGRFNVIIYKGGNSSDDSTQWRNRRTQSYIGMRDYYREGKLLILDSVWDDDSDWEDYSAQVCSIKSKPGAERVEDLMTKEEMKKRGIKSPDMADGDAMIFATQEPVIGGRNESIVEVVGESECANYDAGLI